MYPLLDTDASVQDSANAPEEQHDTAQTTYTHSSSQHMREMASEPDVIIASFAHDIKNPLTTIMGRVELLKRLANRPSITPADVARHVEPLVAAVSRLANLIQNFSTGTHEIKDTQS